MGQASIDIDPFPKRVEVTESGQATCECLDPDRAVCEPLRVHPLDAEPAAKMAAGFKALGDPNRVAILHLLAVAGDPVCVVDIERHIDLAQSTISHHLKTLVDAGVISRERRGKWSYYAILGDRLSGLISGLSDLAATPVTTG